MLALNIAVGTAGGIVGAVAIICGAVNAYSWLESRRQRARTLGVSLISLLVFG